MKFLFLLIFIWRGLSLTNKEEMLERYNYSEVISKALNNNIELNPTLVSKRENVEQQYKKIKSTTENTLSVTEKNQKIIDQINEKIQQFDDYLSQAKEMESQIISDFELEKKKIEEEYQKKVIKLSEEFEEVKKTHPNEMAQKEKDD